MKIVVLDGYTLNPGDLSWEPLEALGTCTIHDRTPGRGSLPGRRSGDPPHQQDAPDLSDNQGTPLLALHRGAGNGIQYRGPHRCAEAGVVLTNVPTYSTMSVAQVVFAHLLNLTHSMGHHTQAVRDGRWSSSPDFTFGDAPLIELAGKTLGIIGLGRIGTAVAKMGMAFGMDVIAYDRSGRAPLPEIRAVSLDDVFAMSDVLTLHCPLTPDTKHLVNAERLAMMKPTAFLINTSRGPLIDEPALADALNSGMIAGAGLDVLSAEPPPPDNPLLRARNCHITPHFAWASTAARRRLMEEVG